MNDTTEATPVDFNENAEQTQSEDFCKKVRGSDPHAATCRGRLQFQRSKLNQEINKQTMMRNGAEKLYRATTNKKLKETVALELSFVNSSLQLLKEQLADLNSSVQVYQNDNKCPTMPMIPLGLKETKQIDFKDPFKDFILEHYSEDDSKYEAALEHLNSIRQAIRTPTRDQAGIQLLFQYYNLLYYVDKRFFPSQRNMGVYFEWFDSLTGLPSTQKSVAFEKACVLFNIAALHTQIGAKQDRTKTHGMESAVDHFLRAAGIFYYIKKHFSNPPSTDLSLEVLDMLTQLMLAQARECLLEKLAAETQRKKITECLEIAQEAAQMADVYSQVYKLVNSPTIKDCVPDSWSALIHIKAESYTSVSHHYVAIGLLNHTGEISSQVKEKLEFLHIEDKNSEKLEIKVPQNINERLQLGKGHLRQAVLIHEEALRWYRMCRQLQLIDSLYELLRASHEVSLNLFSKYNEDDDEFQDILEPPPIRASTKYQLTLSDPDFTQYKVADPFKGLGPLKFFSAKRHWTAARIVELLKADDQSSFGFSVKDDAPVVVTRVEIGGIAEGCGLKEGDYIAAVGDLDTKWATHEEMAHHIKAAGNAITLKVVTPMNWKYMHSKAGLSVCSKSTTSSSSGVSSTSSRNPSPVGSVCSKDSEKRHSWNPFRRRNSKDPLESSYINNVVFR